MDPLSILASGAGILALAITVTEKLSRYYTAYKSQGGNIKRTAERLEVLTETLRFLETTLKSRGLRDGEEKLIVTLQTSLSQLTDSTRELQVELAKCQQTGGEVKAFAGAIGRRLAYPFRESTLTKLSEDIHATQECASLTVSALQFHNDQQIADDVLNIKRVIDVVQATTIDGHLRDWLRAPDASPNHNAASIAHYPATGLWLTQGAQFKNWLVEPNSFLWLYGFAGSGKSVLCSTAIDQAYASIPRATCAAIGFFYFSFSDEAKRDTSSMLRALLLQLATQIPRGQDSLTRLRDQYPSGPPGNVILLECLKQLMKGTDCVYLFVDALDEVTRGQKRNVLLETINTIRAWALPSLHLLVTARDEVDIRDLLQVPQQVTVHVQNKSVNEDIATFVRGRLQTDVQLLKWKAHRDRIEQVLTEKAHGVFRWVECQFEAIRQCPRSTKRLEQCLNTLPQTLDETYERVLTSISQDSAQDARRILTLLCYAKRPITVAELIDALAVDLEGPGGPDADLRLDDPDSLLEICPNLITFEERGNGTKYDDDQRHTFILSSDSDVSDHFPRQQISPEDSFERCETGGSSDGGINDDCLPNRLADFEIEICLPEGLGNLEIDIDEGDHGEDIDDDNNDQDNDNNDWDNDNDDWYDIIDDVYNNNDDWDDWDDNMPLQRIIRHEVFWNPTGLEKPRYLPSLKRRPLSKASEIVVRIAHFSVQEYLESNRILSQPARQYALNDDTGHAEIAKICLLYLQDPILRAGHADAQALADLPFVHYAAGHWVDHYHRGRPDQFGDDCLVRRLFVDGSNVLYNWNRIRGCSLVKWNEILRGPLPGKEEEKCHSKEDRIALFKQNFTAIYCAARSGITWLVEHLILAGALVNPSLSGVGKPLHAAIKGNRGDVVRLLLRHGADPKAIRVDYGYALSEAAYLGHVDCVVALLDHGDDVTATRKKRTCSSRTPLSVAISVGNHEIAAALIAADAGLRKEHPKALLLAQFAVYKGLAETVQQLLNTGLDVNFRSRGARMTMLDRRTIYFDQRASLLELAVTYQQQDIVQVLLALGADARPDLSGRSVSCLCRAACRHNVQIFEMILDSLGGIQPGSPDQMTALRFALQHGPYHIVRSLVAAVPSPNLVLDDDQSKSLMTAITLGDKLSIKILIRLGALYPIIVPSVTADEDGYTMIQGAQTQEKKRAESTGVEMPPLHAAARDVALTEYHSILIQMALSLHAYPVLTAILRGIRSGEEYRRGKFIEIIDWCGPKGLSAFDIAKRDNHPRGLGILLQQHYGDFSEHGPYAWAWWWRNALKRIPGLDTAALEDIHLLVANSHRDLENALWAPFFSLCPDGINSLTES